MNNRNKLTKENKRWNKENKKEETLCIRNNLNVRSRLLKRDMKLKRKLNRLNTQLKNHLLSREETLSRGNRKLKKRESNLK